MARDDLEIRMRTRGAGRSKAQVDVVTASVERLGLAGTRTGARLSAAGASSLAFGKKTAATARMVNTASGAMARSVSLPLTAAAVGVSYMAADFEKTMNKMVGLVGVPIEEIAAMSKEVLKMGETIPVAPTKVAEALYFLTSSGLNAKQSMIAVRAAARGAAAGLGDIAPLADGISSAMNAWGHNTITAVKATDIFVAAAKAGKAEPEDFANTMGRVLPIASELGVTFEDTAGAVAAMTLTGNDAAEATTALRQMLQKLIKPGAAGVTTLKKYGMSLFSVQQHLRKKGLLATLIMLRKEFNNNSRDLSRLFQGVEGFNGMLALTGKNSKTTQKAMAIVENHTGLTAKAFDAASKTSMFKFQQALTKLKVAAIKLGDILLPVLIPIVEWFAEAITDAAEAFHKLPKPMQTAMLIFGAMLIVLPLVAFAVSGVVAAFAGIAVLLLGAPLKGAFLKSVGSPAAYGAAGTLRGAAFGLAFKAAAVVGFIALASVVAVYGYKAGVAFGEWVTKGEKAAEKARQVARLKAWEKAQKDYEAQWGLGPASPRRQKPLQPWEKGFGGPPKKVPKTKPQTLGAALDANWAAASKKNNDRFKVGGKRLGSSAAAGIKQSAAGIRTNLREALNPSWASQWGKPKFEQLGNTLGTALATGVGTALDALILKLERVATAAGGGAAPPPDGRRERARGGFAHGGLVGRSGVYNVGERGREKVYLPRGAMVEPNGGFGGEIVVPVTLQVDGQVLAKTVRRQAVRKLATR